MGNVARSPSDYAGPNGSESEQDGIRLGDLLAGKFSDVNVDSVEAVRETREDE